MDIFPIFFTVVGAIFLLAGLANALFYSNGGKNESKTDTSGGTFEGGLGQPLSGEAGFELESRFDPKQ